MPSPFIFTDTSAWSADVDNSDAHHPAATQFIHTLPGCLHHTTLRTLHRSSGVAAQRSGRRGSQMFAQNLLNDVPRPVDVIQPTVSGGEVGIEMRRAQR